MLVLVSIMLMSHTSLHFFVSLYFVLTRLVLMSLVRIRLCDFISRIVSVSAFYIQM